MSLKNSKILMVGCGKMGFAMLEGWLSKSLKAENVQVIDPFADKKLFDNIGVRLNKDLSEYNDAPDIIFFAVKPQGYNDIAPEYSKFHDDRNSKTLFVSIIAGKSTESIAKPLGARVPVIRTMPNLPATIGVGITGVFANKHCSETQIKNVSDLLEANGEVVNVSEEKDIDAITGVSGSGPAYIFHLIEAMSEVAEQKGLSKKNSYKLALNTIYGAAKLAKESDLSATTLRENVTSPNGTTQAGLDELMKQDDSGMTKLMDRTISAAIKRAEELNN